MEFGQFLSEVACVLLPQCSGDKSGGRLLPQTLSLETYCYIQKISKKRRLERKATEHL